MKLVNVIRNSAQPGQFRAVVSKVMERLRRAARAREAVDARDWCKHNAEDYVTYASGIDAELWQEAVELIQSERKRADEILAGLNRKLGGGANYPLLYFLVRYHRPARIVETGVAAGYSSFSILTALKDNDRGHLWSSDLPYLKHDAPERDIGILVPDNLRERWSLFIKGDRDNLAEIVQQCGSVDLVSYDSDKSYHGRTFAMGILEPRLVSNGVVLMDDIQDNFFFRDYFVDGESERNWETHVFEFEGKYVGLAIAK